MKEIESVRVRMSGEPTFKNRCLTISNMLHSLAQGNSIKDFAKDHEIDIQCVKNALQDIAENIRSWMRPKECYELWEATEDDGTDDLTFTVAENVGELMSRGLLSPNSDCTWRTMAESRNEAFAEYYRHMNWEEYRPMLNCDDEPYSGDEGDTIATYEDCNECGNTLDSCGYCTDVYCPYSNCLQDEEPDE
jgi:uncharacterized protein (DUF433 family)